MRALRPSLAVLGSVALCLGLATTPATGQTEEPATDLADLLPAQIGETPMYPAPAAEAEKLADGLVAEGFLAALQPLGLDRSDLAVAMATSTDWSDDAEVDWDRFVMLVALRLEGIDAKDLMTAGSAVMAFVGEESTRQEGTIGDCWFLYEERTGGHRWTLAYPRDDIIYFAMSESEEPSLQQTLTALSCLDEAEATGTFGPAGSLAEVRDLHTATLLPDGRVLVVGGNDGQKGYRASAVVWDPVTESFAPAGSLAEARAGHTATRLLDGRVLLIGGRGASDDGMLAKASAEIWDPETGSFARAGSLAEAREGHTATLLPDGRVLVVGGVGEARTTVASAEVWDPETEAFGPTGSLAQARSDHTATRLLDGRVLVIGGLGGWDSAEVWDSVTESFAPAGSLVEPRQYHTATLLPDGRVLVIGPSSPRAEAWDPDTESFSHAGWLADDRQFHTATLLPDGRVLVVGGMGSLDIDGEMGTRDSAEVWDSDAGRFLPAGSLAQGRAGHTATLLPDGRVLVVGGWDRGALLAPAEAWSPIE